MATTPEAEDGTVASHTLAYLRALDRKMDLLVETAQRHNERFTRVERDIAETRQTLDRSITELKRDITELKSDIALLENKVLTAQTEILVILHRLDGQRERRPDSGTP